MKSYMPNRDMKELREARKQWFNEVCLNWSSEYL